MSDNYYTPTTDEIREYVEGGGEPRPWEALDEEREAARAAAFDRWFAAEQARVWDECAKAVHKHVGRLEDAQGAGQGVMVPDLVNPYR